MLPLAIIILSACGPDVSVSAVGIDADNDGYDVQVDCDEANKAVNPTAPEVCDDLDNDCDGLVDNDAVDANDWYADADGDGYGDPRVSQVSCVQPEATVADATDCDDAEARAFPGHGELCDDIDNDCNGLVDDNPADVMTWFEDADGDGYGEESLSVDACDAPIDYVNDAQDCDDDNSAVHPDAAETDCGDPTDYNCDGSVDFADVDADGVPACEDCDDTDPRRSPSNTEVCDIDNVDEDCSGAADDDDAAAAGRATWTRDADGDGYGNDGGLTVDQCDEPSGYALGADDCDDTDPGVNPAAAEVCDSVDTDEDCSGSADDLDVGTDPATFAVYYADTDGDLYGDPSRSVTQCDAPSSFVTTGDDCDDADDAVHPAAAELCNLIDDDCDGLTDDDDAGVYGASIWYVDADGDGYGGTTTTSACAEPAGYVPDATDCDDGAAAVNPAASEVCDAYDVDEDCDGGADDGDTTATGRATWYPDADGDAFGGMPGAMWCDAPASAVADASDCDDTDAAVNPAGLEVCGDGVDDDCDGADLACTTVSLSSADAKLTGEAAGDYAGYEMIAADIDADGLDELVISSYAGASAGVVYVVDDGATGVASLGGALAKLSGETTMDMAGTSLAAGDVDGDGVGDIIIGAPSNDDVGTNAGAAYVVFGPPAPTVSLGGAVTLDGPSVSDQAGGAATTGDFDGDGQDDVAIGAVNDSRSATYAGAVYIKNGPITGSSSLAAADAALLGENATDFAGWSMAGGDLNGDGVDDLVIGAVNAGTVGSFAGGAYVVLGPVTGTTGLGAADAFLTGEAAGDFAGHAVSVADGDGDGLGDAVVTACFESSVGSSGGAVYAFYSPVAGTRSLGVADVKLTAEAAADVAGESVWPLDYDGDGADDLLVGARNEDTAGTNAGAAYLFLGLASGTFSLADADVKYTGEAADNYAGHSVAAGWFNSAGVLELAVGAYYEDTVGTNAGAVYVIAGP